MEEIILYTKRVELTLLTINTPWTPAFKFEVGEDGKVNYHGEYITPREATERFPSDSGLEMLSSTVAKVTKFFDEKDKVKDYFWETLEIII